MWPNESKRKLVWRMWKYQFRIKIWQQSNNTFEKTIRSRQKQLRPIKNQKRKFRDNTITKNVTWAKSKIKTLMNLKIIGKNVISYQPKSQTKNTNRKWLFHAKDHNAAWKMQHQSIIFGQNYRQNWIDQFEAQRPRTKDTEPIEERIDSEKLKVNLRRFLPDEI